MTVCKKCYFSKSGQKKPQKIGFHICEVVWCFVVFRFGHKVPVILVKPSNQLFFFFEVRSGVASLLYFLLEIGRRDELFESFVEDRQLYIEV